MTQFAASNFDGTENALLSTFDANWVKHSLLAGTAEITSNRARQSNSSSALYYYNATPPSADYSVSADLYFPSSSGSSFTGVAGRISSSVNSLYLARHDSASGNAQLYKFVSGTATLLGAVSRSITTLSSKNIKLEMVGSAIKLYWDGATTADVSATDTGVTAAGFAGIRFGAGATPDDSTGYQLDNFSADTIDSGSGVNLAGNAQAIASASGALSTAIPLAGAALEVATASGALSTAFPLSGAAAAVASASGNLVLGIALSGTALAQAVASGALSSAFPMAGGAVAQLSASGALAISFSLAGSALMQAQASGALTVGGASSLAGQAQINVSAGGQLRTAVPLAGSAQIVASADGSPATGTPISGAAVAAVAASGNLDIRVSLSGLAVAQAIAAGGMALQIPLAGHALSIVSATGSLLSGQESLVSRIKHTVKAVPRAWRVMGVAKSYRVSR